MPYWFFGAKMMKQILVLFLFICGCSGLQGQARSEWPIVAPMKQRFVLKESGPRYVRTRICSPKGDVLYLFHAYLSAEEFFSKELEIQSGFPYGDLECRLTENSQKGQGNSEPYILLNTESDPPNEWSHRGIFWIDAMEKNPADLNWGLSRSFSLRGMTFSIRVLKYDLAAPDEIPYWAKRDRKRLKSAEIEIEVSQNPKAKNPFDSTH